MRLEPRWPRWCALLIVLLSLMQAGQAEEVRPLEIGAPAPNFELPGVDGRDHRLADFQAARFLVVIFTCNHCPTAQAYEERIIQLYEDYKNKGVALVAISPNDPLAVRLDELGYSDIGDSLEEMQIHARRRGFQFPYLYDGQTQSVSKAFGVLATPHVFIFDQERKLRYNGRIDDADITPPQSHDARKALDELLVGQPVTTPKTRVFGCSTKWSDKRPAAEESLKKWDAEPVELKQIDAAGLRALAANKTQNFRLINLWSTSCVPCIAEFPDLVTINRMYRRRHFEMITLCIDPPQQQDLALKFLRQQHVSCTNFIFHSENRDALAEALDPSWEGPVPYTLLIAPGGEIIQRWKDVAEPARLKSEIVERLGRTYASRK